MVPVSSPGGPTKENKILDNKFKIFFVAFIVFTIFLLFEGFFWFYSAKLSWFCFDTLSFSHWCVDAPVDKKYAIFDRYRGGYNPLIWNENGLVENLQILLLFFAIVNYIIFFKKKEIYNTSKFLIYFIYLYFLGLIYFFLEEISWGQQFFNWQSPEFFLNLNNQHNKVKNRKIYGNYGMVILI